MQDEIDTGGETDDHEYAKNSALSAAYARFKLIPITWRIAVGAFLGVLFLAAFATFLPHMKERLKFFVDSAFAWLVFVIIVVQSYIYQRQTKIMGVSYYPRLQVTSVRVANLRPDEEPIFIVSVKNFGAIDATGVLINLRVSFGRPVESTLAQKLSQPQVVTIAAGEEHTYAIPWDQPVKQEHIDRLKKVPLLVSGFIKLRDEKEREFCYRYYPLKGERPEGVPEFIPCDFNTGLTRVITPEAARLRLTAHAPEVIITRPNQSEEASQQEQSKPESKGYGEKPN